MNISDVRIRLVKKHEGRLRAIASVTIDDSFVIHDVKILDGDDGYFIAMPSRQTPRGEFKDIAHPINTETRDELKRILLDELEKALALAGENED